MTTFADTLTENKELFITNTDQTQFIRTPITTIQVSEEKDYIILDKPPSMDHVVQQCKTALLDRSDVYFLPGTLTPDILESLLVVKQEYYYPVEIDADSTAMYRFLVGPRRFLFSKEQIVLEFEIKKTTMFINE
jgi:hypothetical protein